MIVRDLVNRLMQYVREGELCSCPIIMRNENKVELAVFTYFASDGVPQTVFGYGQLIKSNGESIETEEKVLFHYEVVLIIINMLPFVSFDNYYSHLQNAIHSIKTNGVIENVDALRTAFKAIIPTEAIELYKRICPSFLELIKE